MLEWLIRACSIRNGEKPISSWTQLWNHLPYLPWGDNEQFCCCFFFLCHISISVEWSNNKSSHLYSWLIALWTLWSNSPMCLSVPCWPTELPSSKIKVLFALTCAGCWSEAECQAAERNTAAWPCAERREINDTVYNGWYLVAAF